MAHLVMGKRLGWVENSETARKPWHNAHTPIKLGMTASQANEALDMNFGISKLPSYVEIPVEMDGEVIRHDKILTGYGIVRHPVKDDPNWVSFATVGENYELLQNSQIAELVDILIDSGKWRLETCGALEKGKTLFYLLQTNESYAIASDEHQHYLGITDRRDGLAALRIFPTLVRMECWNTVNLAWNKIETEITVPHSQNMFKEVKWRTDVIARASKAGKAIADIIRNLESVTDVDLDEYLDVLFPLPKAPKRLDLLTSKDDALIEKGEQIAYQFEYRTKKVKEDRELVYANIEYLHDQRPDLPMGFVAFNGLTAYTSHQVNTNKEIRFKNNITGTFRQLQTRAVRYLLSGNVESSDDLFAE